MNFRFLGFTCLFFNFPPLFSTRSFVVRPGKPPSEDPLEHQFDIRFPNNGQDRAAVNTDTQLWSSGIVPYIISPEISASVRASIQEAIKDFEDLTCIRWVPRDPAKHADHIIFKPASGCWSMVGKWSIGGEQIVSLSDGCLAKGIVIHEMLHTLGFWHEQSRPDRDNHVTVNYDHIETGAQNNFLKMFESWVTTLNMEYDYLSVMHYGDFSFSKDGSPTITVKPAGTMCSSPCDTSGPQIPCQDAIGQRCGFSSQDIDEVNALYKCPATAPAPAAPCFDFNPACSTNFIPMCAQSVFVREKFCRKACGTCGGGSASQNEETEAPVVVVLCPDKDENVCQNLKMRGLCEKEVVRDRMCRKTCNSPSTKPCQEA